MKLFLLFFIYFTLTFNNSFSRELYIQDTIYFYASDSVSLTQIPLNSEIPVIAKQPFLSGLKSVFNNIRKQPKDRTTAIVLSILTGFVGGHRIYLGTEPLVVVAYAVTLGGMFILQFIDFVVICFTEDLSRFGNNNKIFMWAK